MESIGIVGDPVFSLHENTPGHPENPGRLRAINTMLEQSGLTGKLRHLPAREATREELSWVHAGSYLSRIAATTGVPYTLLDPDTSANAHSWPAAVRAAGAVMSALEATADGACHSAFALVRPPGHHAEAGQAMGFCLINNVAVAAEFALRRLGRRRVLIVDWDVHHGNGTMHSFYESDRVLFFSVHQYPHYPGSGRIDETGTGAGRGYTVNVPLPAGQGDWDYAAVFDQVLLPVARAFRPQTILVSAGFDIARGDPLGSMDVTEEGVAWMTAAVQRLAEEYCPGQLVFTLEGGYEFRGLADGVSAVLRTLAGDARPDSQLTGAEPSEETAAVIARVRETMAPCWSSLRGATRDGGTAR